MSELDKLEVYLKEHGYVYTRIEEDEKLDSFGCIISTDRHQIIVNPMSPYQWDVICHKGSFGYSQGLLESYCMEEDHGDVTGYQTAEDIIKRLENRHSKSMI